MMIRIITLFHATNLKSLLMLLLLMHLMLSLAITLERKGTSDIHHFGIIVDDC